MSAAAEEANAPAVEKPVEEVKAPNPAKEKKPKAPKENNYQANQPTSK